MLIIGPRDDGRERHCVVQIRAFSVGCYQLSNGRSRSISQCACATLTCSHLRAQQTNNVSPLHARGASCRST